MSSIFDVKNEAYEKGKPEPKLPKVNPYWINEAKKKGETDV